VAQPQPQQLSLDLEVELIITINKEELFTNCKSKLFKREEPTLDHGKSSRGLDTSTERESSTTKDKSINIPSQSPTTDTCGISTGQEFKSLET
jgi:hypothetical protein